MQLSYLRNYANVNPKPHWFGNWQFAYEADVDEVWHKIFSELHVTSGIGANGLFEKELDFQRNLKDGSATEKLIRTYGVPGRTLAELGWKFTKNDFLLRTLRGPFQLLSGHFQEETLVDDIDAEMWLFNPITGSAFHITSEYFFNIQSGHYRDVGYPLIVNKVVDALGHGIELKPSTSIPPFKGYVLSDMSGREFSIELNEELNFLDGLNLGGEVRKHLVSKVTDRTKTTHNVFDYKYNDKHLLEEVIFPSSIGNRYIRYYYEDTNHPGVLTAIENSHGQKIQFEYTEDPTDSDERLNPRLKIRKITDPEGITFEYEYDHNNSEVNATISEKGIIDRKVKYTYIRDIHNTKQRYIVLTEIEVRRGYVVDASGNVIPRQPNSPQIIRDRTEYTKDGRFNIKKEIDPLNRSIEYKYNDFNQIEKIWDFDNHWTRYTYAIPDNPSPTRPICYDLLSEEKENILRVINPTSPMGFLESATIVKKDFEYAKYDSDTSLDNDDHGTQSTHRILKMTDERGKHWVYTYDDSNNYNPLSPTLTESPLQIKTKATYNNRGQPNTITDSENNIHTYIYNEQGAIEEYIDPNQEKIKKTYYSCGNWLRTFEDQLTKTTEFEREVDGRTKKIKDPVGDSIDYRYYKNGRLSKIIQHRLNDPSDNNSGTKNLETTFRYMPSGTMNYLKNPKGLELLFEYDEAGRMFEWYQNVSNPKKTKFVFDEAGQLKKLEDRKGQSTDYTYHNSGLVKSIQYPDWSDHQQNIPGKLIEFKKYDYLGKVFSVIDSEMTGSKEFVYDEAGNVLFRRDPDGFELTFHYDDDNRLDYIVDGSGDYELNLTLDDLGRPTDLDDSNALDGSLKWKYKYEKQVSGKTKVLNLFERSLPSIDLMSEFDYDKKNRLASIKNRWTSPDQLIYSQIYHYRDDDQIERIENDDANSFRYDRLKQLIYEERGNLSSDYDDAGNRLFREDKNVVPNPPVNEYNELNQLKKDKRLNADFTYDNNGNLKTSTYSVSPTEFFFDGANRLRFVKNNHHEISFLYDYEGKLVERKVKDLGNGDMENTYFSYLLSKPIVIKRNGDLYMLLTWDNNGRLLRIRKYEPVGTGSYQNSLFPLEDGLGNIVRFVDDAKNAPVIVSYDAWGEIQNLTDTMGLFEFWGHGGGIFDRIIKCIILGARWYMPIIGRWISEDPIGHSKTRSYLDSINLYVYTYNNPILYNDPLGLSPGDPYPDPDSAAIAALNEIMATSRGLDREWGGIIYMNMDGTFSYTTPIQGMRKGLPAPKNNPIQGRDWDWFPPGTNVAGWYHAHGRQDPNYTEQFFSGSLMRAGQPGDTDVTIQGVSVTAYVGIPGRKIGEQGNKIVKYTPNHPRPQPSDFKVLQGPQSLPKVDIPQ